MSHITKKHEDDIKIVGQYLMQHAEMRGWCSDYDNFIKDVNALLMCPLPEYVPENNHEFTNDPADVYAKNILETGTAELDYPDLVIIKRNTITGRAIKQKHVALGRIDILEEALKVSRNLNFDDLIKIKEEATLDYLMGLHEEIIQMLDRLGFAKP